MEGVIMQQQSRGYGFRVGEEVKTSPEFNKNHSAGAIVGTVSGMYSADGYYGDGIYVLDAAGSSHSINEYSLIPPEDWQERIKSGEDQ